MSNFMNRDSIRSLKPTIGEAFFVAAWQASVNIRKWSGKQRAILLTKVSETYGESITTDQINLNTKDFPGMNKLMATVVSASICDENGINIYDFENNSDIEEVENFDADLLQLLFEESAKRNGLVESSLKTEIKNSETTQNSDSI